MDIGILGSGSEEVEVSLTEQILVNLGFRNSMNKRQFNEIMEAAPYKPVHEALMPFIGVYDLEVVNMPDWYSSFFTQVITSFVESIPDDVAEEVEKDYAQKDPEKFTTKIAKKLYDLRVQINTIEPKQFHEGYFPDGKKILKTCKSLFEFINPENKGKADQQDWYKLYESKKAATKGLKLVITNSTASSLLLSSAFDNTGHGSCQSIHRYSYSDGNCRRLPSNLKDMGSLVAYVTAGRVREDLVGYSGKKLNGGHVSMITRTIIRLCQDSKGKFYILPDRAYPHDAYSSALFSVILNKIKEDNLDIKLAKFSSYSQQQGGGGKGIKFSTTGPSFKVATKFFEPLIAIKAGWGDGADCSSCKRGSCFYGKDHHLHKNCSECYFSCDSKSALPYHDNMSFNGDKLEFSTNVKLIEMEA